MLTFTNPGEIDIRGATIAGLSAKSDESAIGYFGTGLKYAIAQVLANGGSIKIWSGLSCHAFRAKELDFRGSTHSQVIMDSQEAGILGDTAEPAMVPLGFTTHYGSKWAAWQIFRELYANALDEGGTVERNKEPAIAPDRTVIVVEGWPDLQACFHERNRIILPPELEYDDDAARLRVANASASSVYYKGVRVADRRCEMTWNFKEGITLTEDRTADVHSWEVSNAVCDYIIWADNETIIRKFLGCAKGTFEESVQGWFNPPKKASNCSPTFATVSADLYRQDPVKWREYEELALDYEPALRQARVVALSPLQTRMLDKAKRLVALMGYAYEVEHLPIIVENLGGKTLGRYKDGAISLSPLIFDQGTKQVVSTLYEECLHAKLGYRDCTYEMQTHLFNVIVGLFEEAWGEPC